MLEEKLCNISEIKVHGRTAAGREPLTLFWTASGFECNVSGTELSVELEVTYDTFEPWFSYTVNGDWVGRQMLPGGRYWVTLFRGMSPDKIKNVRFYKDLQAMSDDHASLIHVHRVRFDGKFYPVADKKKRIEFIGDSITSGEGLFGAADEEDWIPMFFSSLRGYPHMVAQRLDAEYRIFSQSGWGIHHGWDNNIHHRLMEHYDNVCSLMNGAADSFGAMDKHDFSSWQPDICVIILGTNDASGFHQPMWLDADTGESYKARLMENGSPDPDDVGQICELIKQDLGLVRSRNPHAFIIWCYGMLGNDLLCAIKSCVEEYGRNNNDDRIAFLQLPDTTAATVGSRMHPGELSHRLAADRLVEYITESYNN